ncbi:hypothetical protein [Mucilaginibacter sp.]|uniref:HD domain-containing protein n=1 Tax=Mucilaginibacter sp. TaxID=1882438 RepID=UPI003265C2CF
MARAVLVTDAENYVRELLSTQLSPDMYFHDLGHTERVVKAAIDIAQNSGFSKKETIIVEIAAWFHDTGYCYAYTGHEDNSIAIAATFLKQQGADEKFIAKISGCILATQIPQNPTNLMEEVLCDADLSHFSRADYPERAAMLRMEWAARLKKEYTDRDWFQSNISLLTRHTYFTPYGKTVLQQNKLNNIDALLAGFPK